MAEDIDKRLASASLHEGVPSLRAVKVSANTVGEAMKEAEGGAGQVELDWVLAKDIPDTPENQDARRKRFAKARKMLKGNKYFFFFPSAADGVGVPYVYWLDGRFERGWGPRGDWWRDYDRVVQVG